MVGRELHHPDTLYPNPHVYIHSDTAQVRADLVSLSVVSQTFTDLERGGILRVLA